MLESLFTFYAPPFNLIECGHNEDYTLWYRIYENNFIKQGGVYVAKSSNSTSVTINLPLEMKDTNYFGFVYLSTTGEPYDAGFANAYHVTTYSKTTTSFQLVDYNYKGLKHKSWFVCGYMK